MHKWIDVDGITHYSDAPPRSDLFEITRIDTGIRKNTVSKGDYYSIANQWARMQRERRERDRIKLEQERLRAARQPTRTEVVYVEKPESGIRYVSVYPRTRYLRHSHYRSYHKRGSRLRYSRHRAHRNDRASIGYFKHVE